MTELGKEILKYILSKTTYDGELILCSDVRENFKSIIKLKYEQSFNFLKKHHYIDTTLIPSDQKRYVYITSDGVDYLENNEKDLKRYSEEKHRSWIQFWIPVGISIVALGIAIASLIIDIQK